MNKDTFFMTSICYFDLIIICLMTVEGLELINTRFRGLKKTVQFLEQ